MQLLFDQCNQPIVGFTHIRRATIQPYRQRSVGSPHHSPRMRSTIPAPKVSSTSHADDGVGCTTLATCTGTNAFAGATSSPLSRARRSALVKLEIGRSRDAQNAICVCALCAYCSINADHCLRVRRIAPPLVSVFFIVCSCSPRDTRSCRHYSATDTTAPFNRLRKKDGLEF